MLTLGMAFQRFNLAIPKIGRAKLGFLVFGGVTLHLLTTFVHMGDALSSLCAWLGRVRVWWGVDGFV